VARTKQGLDGIVIALQPWIDKIAMELMIQKNMNKSGNFDPYSQQLEVVNEAAVKGDFGGMICGNRRSGRGLVRSDSAGSRHELLGPGRS
jgi:hypothetical protein